LKSVELEKAVAEWLAEVILGRRDRDWLTNLGANKLLEGARVIRQYAA